MTLGDLITTLETAPPSLPVYLSDGTPALKFYSWRGSYDELTLHSVAYENKPAISARDLVALAKKADGATFHGYKGGEYKMSLATPVWADPYGDYYSRAITGMEVEADRVVLTLVGISEYR